MSNTEEMFDEPQDPEASEVETPRTSRGRMKMPSKSSKKSNGHMAAKTKISEEDSGSDLEDAVGAPNESMQQLVAKIRKKSGLSHFDQELMRIVGQHLNAIGLRNTAEVLMKEAGVQLIHPVAMNFKKMVLNGEWTSAVKSKNCYFFCL